MAGVSKLEVSNVNNRTCPNCGTVFQNSGSCVRHINTRGCTSMRCSCCKQYYDVANGLEHDHYPCPFCGFPNERSYKPEVWISKRQIHKCSDCNRPFSNVRLLKLHRHKGSCQKVQCLKCGRDFANNRLLQAHQKECHRIFQCQICNKRFAKQSVLKNHMKVHTKNYTNRCDLCKVKFATRKSLNLHINKAHANLVKLPGECATCAVCNRVYRDVHSFKYHVTQCHKKLISSKTGNLSNISKCQFCKQKVRFEDFAAHVHKELFEAPFGKRSYQCGECDLQFSTKKAISLHSIVHQKKLEELSITIPMQETSKSTGVCFYCIFCNQKFSSLILLQFHVNLHTMERPYFREECNGFFHTVNDLQRHARYWHKRSQVNSRSEIGLFLGQAAYDRCMSSQSLKLKQHINETPIDKLLLLSCPFCKSTSINFSPIYFTEPAKALVHISICVYNRLHGTPRLQSSTVEKLKNDALLLQDKIFSFIDNKEDFIHKCTSCKVGMKTRDTLYKHEQFHMAIDVNSKQLTTRKIKKPLPKTSRNGPMSVSFTCPICNQESSSHEIISKHYEDDHFTKTFIKFKRFESAPSFIRQIHGGRYPSNGCFVCGRTFFSKRVATGHINLCVNTHRV